jgi:hypothetical protein
LGFENDDGKADPRDLIGLIGDGEAGHAAADDANVAGFVLAKRRPAYRLDGGLPAGMGRVIVGNFWSSAVVSPVVRMSLRPEVCH